MTEPREPLEVRPWLSAAGMARQQALRQALVARVESGGRRRRLAGAALLVVGAMLAGLVAWHDRTRGGVPGRQEGDGPGVPVPDIVVVHDDPTILGRWAAPAGAARIERIDDRDLLRLLAEAGRPTGLVRTADRAWTVRDVTDGRP